MSQYQVVKIVGGLDLFENLPKKEILVTGSNLIDFKIKNQSNNIRGTASIKIRSIRSTEENEIIEELFINLLIKKYKINYCLVNLSGTGLVSIHSYPKYISENVLKPLKDFLKEKFELTIQFENFEYSNHHFSKTFWNESLRSKLAYNSNANLWVRISSPDCNEIIEGNEKLKKYYSSGNIRYITAIVPELEYQKNNLTQAGKVKFSRNGMFKCLFSDVMFFDQYIDQLIDQGFFGDSK